jgi:hypothetical protein
MWKCANKTGLGFQFSLSGCSGNRFMSSTNFTGAGGVGKMPYTHHCLTPSVSSFKNLIKQAGFTVF